MSDEREPSQRPEGADAAGAEQAPAASASSNPPSSARASSPDAVRLPPIPGLVSNRYAGRVPLGSATLRASVPPTESQGLKRPHLPQRKPMPSPLLDMGDTDPSGLSEEDAANQSKIFTGPPVRPTPRPRRLVPPPKPSSHPSSIPPDSSASGAAPRRRMTPAPYNPATITAMRIISIGVEDKPSDYESPPIPQAPPVARVEVGAPVQEPPLPAFELSDAPAPVQTEFAATLVSSTGEEALPSAVERQLAPLPAFELSQPEPAPVVKPELTPLPAFEMTETNPSLPEVGTDAVTVPIPTFPQPDVTDEQLPAFELPEAEPAQAAAAQPAAIAPLTDFEIIKPLEAPPDLELVPVPATLPEATGEVGDRPPPLPPEAALVPLLDKQPSRPPAEPVELSEEEVAAESARRPPPKPPSRTSGSIKAAKPKSDPPAPPVRSSAPAMVAADAVPADAEGTDAASPATKRNPPPPPRRSLPVPETGAEHAGKAQPAEASAAETATDKEDKAAPRGRRPWWEELFNEDYSRALSRLSDEQVKREATFIEEQLGVAEGGVLLDLGCGPGYHAVELAERGYAVVGYDLSLHQLALAADVAQEREQKLNLMQGDMREMAFDSVFDGIYCWNTTFGYFEEEKNLVVAANIFRALKPGGTFLIDVVNRDFVTMQQPSSVWFEGDSAVCMDDMTVDFITSRLRVKRSLMLDDGRTKECPYSIRLYSLHELGKLLHDVGFRVAEASGDPSTPGVFMGQNAPRIIILAQRP